MLNWLTSFFERYKFFEANLNMSGNSSAVNNPNSSSAAYASVASGAYLSSSVACSTKVEPIRLAQDWTIENFAPLLKLCKPGHCLRSHVFRHPSLLEATWQLCMYPAGKRIENAGFISLFLKMSSTSPNREILVTAEYKFHFLDDNRLVKFTNVNVGDFHAKPPKCGHSWGLRNIPKNRVISALRSDGSLLVHCEIEFLPDPCRLRSHALKPLAVSDKDLTHVARSYINNTANLLRGDVLTDCRIVVYAATAKSNSGDGDDVIATAEYDDDDADDVIAGDDVINAGCCDVIGNEKHAAGAQTGKSLNNRNSADATAAESRTADAYDVTANHNRDDVIADPDKTDNGNCSADRRVTFKAHKCLLAAHSDVFKAMFNHTDLRESQKNVIVITDFSPEIVSAMLDYIYTCGTDFLPKLTATANSIFNTGDLIDSTNSVGELLALAEKYSILHLKYACEDFLSGKLAKDNVCQMLALADLHRADSLKRTCVNYFSLNRRDLLNSDEWAELKNLRPKLTNEILEFLLRQQNSLLMDGGDWSAPTTINNGGGATTSTHYGCCHHSHSQQQHERPPEKRFKFLEPTNQNRAAAAGAVRFGGGVTSGGASERLYHASSSSASANQLRDSHHH